MNKYAKLVNGVLFYAPSGMNNILGYNLDSNRERLLADGYKPGRTLPNKDRFVDCEGDYSFEYTETETAVEERAVYHPYGYERLRQKAYPDPAMLYDALVKINSGNDTLAAEGKEQLSAYVQTCLRVKAEYPKPA